MLSIIWGLGVGSVVGGRWSVVGSGWSVLFHKKSWHFSFRKTRIISYGHLVLFVPSLILLVWLGHAIVGWESGWESDVGSGWWGSVTCSALLDVDYNLKFFYY